MRATRGSRALYAGVRIAARAIDRSHLTNGLAVWNRHRAGVIFVYHEISPARLDAQLVALAGLYRFVSLTELADRVAGREPTAGLAAITFDDGFAPVIWSAAELAARYSWPMTFFLPTRFLDTREPYWYQELPELLARAVDPRAKTQGLLRAWGIDGTAEPYAAVNARFKAASTGAEVDQLLVDARVHLLGVRERPSDLPFLPPIGWSSVAELAARNELSFEAHSVNHLAFASLSGPAIEEEMEASKARIEAASGRAVRHFCYPYGAAEEVGSLAPEIARMHFQSAVTTDRGRCRPGSDVARLPRIPLLERDPPDVAALKSALALAMAR